MSPVASTLDRMKRTLAAFALCILCLAASGHQDRLLTLRADGRILELPDAYSATRLHISYLGGYPPSVADFAFFSSGRETVIPECLMNLIQPQLPGDVHVSGSWHHDEALLPYYVRVEFNAATGHPKPASISFLFSLRDARLLEVTQLFELSSQRGGQWQQVVLKNGCPA